MKSIKFQLKYDNLKVIIIFLFLLLCLPNFLFSQSLNGDYYIGDQQGDHFQTINEAVDSLSSAGISGPVVFNIRDGIYEEQIIIPEIAGTSEVNTVTFQSLSGINTDVTIQFNAQGGEGEEDPENYTILLNGADNITLQYLTIKSLASGNGRVIQIQNNCSKNIINSNIIQGISTTSDSHVYTLIYDENSLDSMIHIENNSFIDGSCALYLSGNIEYIGEESIIYNDTAIVIRNNTFQNQHKGFVEIIYNAGFQIVSNNLITNSDGYEFYGISINESVDHEISDNTLSIYGTNSKSDYGIYLKDCNTEMTPGLISNNFVFISGRGEGYGVHCNNSSYQNIYHNSVHITKQPEGESYDIVTPLYIINGNNINVLNNILMSGATAIYIQTPSSIASSNYNNIYTFGEDESLGVWGNDYADSLTQWQTLSSQDLNSLNIDPEFVSEDDLHTFHIDLDGEAYPLSEVETDIDGDDRNDTEPDIGADEFDPLLNDAGVIAIVSPGKPINPVGNELIVRIKNYGYSDLKSVVVDWKFDGIDKDHITWTGTLGSKDSIDLSLGQVNINSYPNLNSLIVWTSSPNTFSDQRLENDTLEYMLKPGLTGDFAIDKNGGDFNSFTSAIEGLHDHGVIGPVTFNIIDDSYNEQIEILDISGANSSNTITFRSGSGDSSLVTLSYNSNTYDNNYIIKLSSANNLVFDHITFKSISDNENYGRVIYGPDENSNITFNGCVIEGPNIDFQTGESTTLVSFGSIDNLFFINNYFKYGSQAIYATGGNSKNLLISNNILSNQWYRSIYLSNIDSVNITDNQVLNEKQNENTCIYLRNCDYPIKIIANNIISKNGGTGIYLDNGDGTLLNRNLIANNMISIGGADNSKGIHLNSASHTNIFYNNVRVASTNSMNSIAYYVQNADSNIVYNNNFVNEGGQRAFYISYSNIRSDYNNFYNNNSGNRLGYWIVSWNQSYNIYDLEDMPSGFNEHALIIDPEYISEYDLHVQNTVLNGRGIPLVGTNMDFDGDLRHAQRPDIGADEFDPPPNDINVLAILSPVAPSTSGDNSVVITIRNDGANQIDSVLVNWEFNGTPQTPYRWKGTINEFDSVNITFGPANLKANQLNTLKIWTSEPNGNADSKPANDTIYTELFTVLSGTYTIGSNSTYFPGFSDAGNALGLGGISSDVIFNVEDGIYNEQLVLDNIVGTESGHSITFQSILNDSTGVILSCPTDSTENYTVYIENTDNVHFKRMTITTAKPEGGRLISASGNINNFECDGVIFTGKETTEVSWNYALLFIYDSDGNNNIIRNSIFNYGSEGMSLANYNGTPTGTIIENNICNDQTRYGILVIGHNAPYIYNNTISSNTTSTSFTGIDVECEGVLKILNNNVNVNSGRYGIYLNYSVGNSDQKGLVANNFVHIVSNATTDVKGIYLSNSDYIGLYFNSVNISGIESLQSRALEINQCNNSDILNNIFANSCNGYSIYNSGITDYYIDYNCYYSSGIENLAYWSGTISDLEALQTANNQDEYSVQTNPYFISHNDLHVSNYLLKDNATPVNNIVTDIDNESRQTTPPDIGADEFELKDADAGIVSISEIAMHPQEVKVKVINYGNDTLTTVDIQWELDGIWQGEETWAGMLLTGEMEEITVGQINYNLGSSYSIRAWTTLPNGDQDMFGHNDTASIEDQIIRMAGIYTIGASGANFNSFGAAVDTLNNHGISAPVVFKVMAGEYLDRIIINEIIGADDENSIIFESESGNKGDVTLYHDIPSSSDNYIVQLNNAIGITFRNLTIKSTNGNYSRVFDIRTNSHNNKILNCDLIGYSGTVTGVSNAIIYAYIVSAHNLEIAGNNFIDGSMALYFYSASSPNTRSRNLIFKDNICETQYYSGVFLRYMDSPSISENRIIIDGYSSATPIYLSNCYNNIKIEKNYISNISGTNGIYMNACYSSADNLGYIINNFIHNGNTGSASGIYLNNSNYINILFNNLNDISSNSSGGRTLQISNGNNLTVKNNNIINKNGYAFFVYGSPTIFDECNYNNIYADTISTGKIGYINSSVKKYIADWKATGLDLNSLSVDPQYISETNLHIKESSLQGAADPIEGIEFDFDNDPRDILNPDIGADEFDFINNVGIVDISPNSGCNLGADQTISVQIKNYGTQDQTGIDVVLSINNQDVTENIGNLIVPAKDVAEYSFTQTYDFVQSVDYDIKSYTTLGTDEQRDDDTLSIGFINNPEFSATVNGDTSMCYGSGITLSASGGVYYSWNNGMKSSDINISPEVTTTYYVTVTDANGCIDNDSVKVTVNPLPTKPVITATGPVEFCNGGTVELVSDITTGIEWSTNVTTPSIIADKSGQYFAIHTDTNGCMTWSDTIEVIEDTQPVISVNGNSTICIGDSVTLSSSGAQTYNWSTGETTQYIKVSPMDTSEYRLIVTTQLGCTYYDTVVLNVYPDQPVGEFFNLLPIDNSNDLSKPVTFSWGAIENTQLFDLFIWNKNNSEPEAPTIEGISGLVSKYNGDIFTYGDTVNWKVVARNVCTSDTSSILTFSLRKLPELHIDTIMTSEALSGATMSVTWTVKNDGEAVTLEGEWYDRIWLTPDIGINWWEREDKMLGIFQNPTTLYPSESYTQTKEIEMPENLIGTYYLFVITDAMDVFNLKYDTLTTPPVPYNPPPYWRGVSLIDNFTQVDMVVEASDVRPPQTGAHTYLYHDNFYYVELDFAVPPLPDLIVDTNNVQSIALSGDTINIQWTVTNQGDENIQNANWSDRVFISMDALFDKENAIGLKTFTNSGNLNADESYTRSEQIVLPANVEGDYFVYVHTDYYDNIFEHLFENNNIARSDTVNIIMAPTPDLYVDTIITPDSASNFQEINIRFDVINSGVAVPNNYWYDRIYLSKNQEYDLSGAINLKSVNQIEDLGPQSAYNSVVKVQIPGNISGEYYIYVYTDCNNNVFENLYEGNNIKRGFYPINIQSPDLIIDTIVCVDTLYSGEKTNIEWATINIGKGNLSDKINIVDRVYISDYQVFDINNARLIGEVNWKNSLTYNQSIVHEYSYTIPEGYAGGYYIHIKTDCNQSLFENEEENNLTTSGEKEVILSPWPDLQVDSVVVNDTLMAGSRLNLTYYIRNYGLARADDPLWYDRIYLSDEETRNNQSLLLGINTHSNILDTSSIYSEILSVDLPASLSSKDYYLIVVTDFNNNVYEHTGDTNNTSVGHKVYIKEYPPIDITVSNLQSPASTSSGNRINIDYTVENVGSSTPLVPSWNDGCYLSDDTIFNKVDDILLKKWNIKNNIIPGDSYSYTREVIIPNGLEGDYYLIMVTDVEDYNMDIDYHNNKVVNSLDIELSPSPDLVIDFNTIPSNIYTGTPFTINWICTNEGNDELENDTWTDKVIISADNTLDAYDKVLYSKTRSTHVPISESYSDSAVLTLSHKYVGNYYIFVKTDYNNNLYEHLGEDNNIISNIVLITVSPPSDLIISDIIAPSTAVTGDEITVDWKLKNNGDYPVAGYIKDLICISKDTHWDAFDPIIGEYNAFDTIVQLQEVTRSITTRIDVPSINDNYIIVKTNVLATINESVDTNNTSHSNVINIQAEEIFLGTPEIQMLNNNQSMYLQLVISEDYVDETMITYLSGDTLYGENELYIKYGELPTRNDYDFAYSDPFSSTQEIIIPELKAGTYYILVHGYNSNSPQQEIRILSEILNFEILSVNSNKGGNSGNVTVEIIGSKFEEGMQARLEGTETIAATNVYFKNKSSLFATFDLENTDIGLYDLVLENTNSDIARLTDGFAIETGTNGSIGVGTGNIVLTCNDGAQSLSYDLFEKSFSIQPEVRPNRIFSFIIYFTNSGNTDITSPIRILTSVDKAPISLVAEDLVEMDTEIILEFKESSGPEGILRPGATGSIIIYSKSTTPTNSSILRYRILK